MKTILVLTATLAVFLSSSVHAADCGCDKGKKKDGTDKSESAISSIRL